MIGTHSVGGFRQACAARGLRFTLEVENDSVHVHLHNGTPDDSIDQSVKFRPTLVSVVPHVADESFALSAAILRAA